MLMLEFTEVEGALG